MLNADHSDPAGTARSPQRPRRSGRLPDIDTQRCTGCGWCVAACELHLLTLERMRWDKIAALHEPQRCTGCSQCAMRCPFGAIDMRMQAVEVTINAA